MVEKSKSQSLTLGLLICLATLAAFWPALGNGFVNFDDDVNFLSNFNYRGLDWAHLKWMWTNTLLGVYQPLSWMSLGLDYIVWGMNPCGYHLTSLLLHMMNAGLFYFLALRLFRLGIADAAEQEQPLINISAIFAALFFAVHPLRVESVAWATERRDVLSGLFYLATLLLYLKACTANRRHLAAATACYLLSLLAKGIGVSLPLVLLVLDVYPLRRLSADPRQWLSAEARPVLLEKIPFWAAALPFAFIGLMGQKNTHAVTSLAYMGIPARLALLFYGPAFYLWKTLVPIRLAPLYPMPYVFHSWARPLLLLSIAVAAALGALLAKLRRPWPGLPAALAYYLLTLAPVSGIIIIQFGCQLVADHRTYFPCLAWAIMAGAAARLALRRSHGPGRAALIIILSAIIGGLGVLTRRQCRSWHDSEALWEYNVSVNPRDALAHDNSGLSLYHSGKLAQAMAEYRQALEIDPDNAAAHNNLGLALAGQGKLAQAMAEYQQALKINPDLAAAHNNLAMALARDGKAAQAIAEYRQALEIDPNNAAIYNNLGRALAVQGELAGAAAELRQALRINPEFAQAHINLGTILANEGNMAEAIAEFKQALEIEPNNAQAANSLRYLLSRQR